MSVSVCVGWGGVGGHNGFSLGVALGCFFLPGSQWSPVEWSVASSLLPGWRVLLCILLALSPAPQRGKADAHTLSYLHLTSGREAET